MNEERLRHIVRELMEEMHSHVHVHLSADQPIPIRVLTQPVARQAILILGGSDMPGQITVDTTNETATVGFLDDKGNTTSAPAGASVTFASSDDSILTVAADANNPLQADITPVAIGSADVSATLSGALEADGTTPIPDPAPVTVTVSAGPAASADFVLSA